MTHRSLAHHAAHPRRATCGDTNSHRTRPLRRTLGLVLATVSLALGPIGAAQAAQPDGTTTQAVALTYNDELAPSYQAEIAQGAGIWNAAVSNVTLVETDGTADFYFVEGDGQCTDPPSTDGTGHGEICLPRPSSGTGTYSPLRVITHSVGHVLGLPDHYSGPCSELMSGGGPGPSCTNASPNATESATVDLLWATGASEPSAWPTLTPATPIP
ncbi:snapalysin family zinc-dependent metalloprotease [Streptomyces odontomachi]|uniref:snapalysin family zinc-dependent metalloprotease n=1 Tax=Streptomyces odontomachi TaxID=2944940 RepID=UPI00210A626A|nr:snapalysin family zinc-dependent metalloprotease [Streptomyces sp. ODS25]